MTFKQTYKPDGSSILGSLGTPGTVPFNNLASAQGTGVLRGVPIGPLTDDASTSDETGLERRRALQDSAFFHACITSRTNHAAWRLPASP